FRYVPESLSNSFFKTRTFCELIAEGHNESTNLRLELLPVLFDLLRPDIPPRREHEVVLRDLLHAHPAAEPRHVLVRPGILLPPPRVVRPREPIDVLVVEHPLDPVDHPPELARVDEQHLPVALPVPTRRLV